MPRAVVLMGGPDAERAVSLESGAAFAAGLRAAGFAVTEHAIVHVTPDDLAAIAPPDGVDVIVPMLHGPWGEGGPLQAVLERHGVPYVGSGPDAAALAMDKMATKARVEQAGIATPAAEVLRQGDACTVPPPLVIKPNDDGSSVDLRICRTAADVAAARHALHARRPVLLGERYVDGRELTVGVVDGRALPIIEITPAVEFYDYAAKYDRDDTTYVVGPDLPTGVAARCRDAALAAFQILGCRDLARVDFLLEDDVPWFLELNTMPGFTSHSLLPMAARSIGMEMPELCASIARSAMARAAVPPARLRIS